MIAARRITLGGTSLAVLVLALLSTGCQDEKVVYRDRNLTAGVPAEAQGYLGYTDVDQKLTVCGNCHVGQQAQWQGTVHAGAWNTLEESGHANDTCRECHTVNSNGNVVTEHDVGWVATQESRYHDVQCESCHGPGLQHVENPDASQPLAPINVGLDLTQGCGQCHSGTHHPFVEEWSQSLHGVVQEHAVGNPDCISCHTAQGALQAFGVNANYLEKDTAAALPIVCAVCHDPHNAQFEGQLRFPITVASVDQNLCMKCHHKRGQPDPTTFRGPHSPEGPLLLGEAGWWPPNLDITPGSEIVGTHGTQANPRLCAGCHVNSFSVTDTLTGNTIFATGHLFQPIPCTDASGAPVASDDCTLDQRTFVSCTKSGCHGSQDAARSAFTVATDRLQTLNDELKALLDQVPASEFDETDSLYTTAEGARFNSEMADLPGTPVHNPFLMEALLTASIKQVEKDYNLAAPASLDLSNELSMKR